MNFIERRWQSKGSVIFRNSLLGWPRIDWKRVIQIQAIKNIYLRIGLGGIGANSYVFGEVRSTVPLATGEKDLDLSSMMVYWLGDLVGSFSIKAKSYFISYYKVNQFVKI